MTTVKLGYGDNTGKVAKRHIAFYKRRAVRPALRQLSSMGVSIPNSNIPPQSIMTRRKK